MRATERNGLNLSIGAPSCLGMRATERNRLNLSIGAPSCLGMRATERNGLNLSIGAPSCLGMRATERNGLNVSVGAPSCVAPSCRPLGIKPADTCNMHAPHPPMHGATPTHAWHHTHPCVAPHPPMCGTWCTTPANARHRHETPWESGPVDAGLTDACSMHATHPPVYGATVAFFGEKPGRCEQHA
eukprot:363302-Chlamydomonas_euryale.AAC.18